MRPERKRRRRRRGSTISGAPVRLRIDSLAAGGEGLGRLADGRVLFVHRTAPGDVVEAGITMDRPRWARGRLLRVLEPSPDRREAPCPHYAECGGCTLEHLRYDAQLTAKGKIVADALQRIGRLDVKEPTVIPSPREHRYRNRVSFALRRLEHGRVVAGFHALGDPHRIVPIDGRCLLPEEPLARVWDALRAAWGEDAHLLPAGETLRLTLRATAGGAVSLLVEGGFTTGRLESLPSLVEGLSSVWHRSERGNVTHVAGAPGLPETWGAETFEVPGAAFLQVNRKAAELLEEQVIALAGEVGGLRVVDAYCGIGLHARRLAKAGARVKGIELDPQAVRVATDLATERAEFQCGRVEDLLHDALPADLVVLNPPRAGVDGAAVDALLLQPPPRIIYVSCDPATLARDLARLSTTFTLRDIVCFDLFPQTAHVETVVLLHRTTTA